ncbi:sigma-70 family RNA polymerase sigma factor [Kitasatospora aureofaciens]|uniref:sigma-70 family RNA polymerase sigma factor n=1 Tax=Kitasatospora aureofaciens TaxID=1894 RepID=UPI0027DF1184|nr:sigma-70 family RNA polymerase sigma factor [Kitasatospora aureofaciens]
MSAEEQNDYGYGLDFGRTDGLADGRSAGLPDGASGGLSGGMPGQVPGAVPGSAAGPSAGHVPDQAGMPGRESLSASAAALPSGRVPGQAPAGRGGVAPEAFVGDGRPVRPTVPAPADPVDGERPPSDAELTARVRAGDDTAYEEIYRRHADSVRRYARTCCRDSFTAEDLAGEVFARTLQALRAGKGPGFAVRAYLLTAVRNVAAAWTRSERREQLVDDFSVFAQTSAAVVDLDLADPGADAWTMAMADQRMVMQAYAELPEDDRVVLWHTEVERESPKTVAVMLGKTANATAVQAHRARDRLAAGFLQAHVSGSQDGSCEAYAGRLGAYARGSLRKRASAEVGRHLKECDRCTAACLELSEINTGLRALLPGGVLVWVGVAGFSAAAAAVGGAAVVGGAAAGTTAATSGSTAGSAAGAGASGAGAGGAGAAGGAAGGSGSSAAAVAGEGLGTAAKAGIAAAVAVAAAAVAAYALTSSSEPKPPVAAPVATTAPAAPSPAAPVPAAPAPAPTSADPTPEPASTPSPAAKPSPSPTRTPTPTARTAPAPTPAPTGAPPPKSTPAPPAPPAPTVPPVPTPEVPPVPTPEVPVVPTPTPPPVPTPTVTPPSPPAPTDFWADSLPVVKPSNHRVPPPGPSIRQKDGDWFWQRSGAWIGGDYHPHAITVHAPATTRIDLNRSCTSFDAVAGVDDLTASPGGVIFSVQGGDGSTLWHSRALGAGDDAVPVHVPLAGQTSIRLVVTPVHGIWSALNVADWAEARFRCS